MKLKHVKTVKCGTEIERLFAEYRKTGAVRLLMTVQALNTERERKENKIKIH